MEHHCYPRGGNVASKTAYMYILTTICVKLQQDMLLGFDFAEHFSIGIDWDTQGTPYL